MHADDTTVRIPLRAKDGSVRAYALIDAADFAAVNQWTWRLNTAGRGYASRSGKVNGRSKTFLMHRFIMGTEGEPREIEVDHINGDGLDNRRRNLRIVTHAQNMQNRRLERTSTSGVRGVSWDSDRKKWRATVKVNRKDIKVGRFDTIAAAAAAVKAARARLMTHAQ